jgi:hypothetical protein
MGDHNEDRSLQYVRNNSQWETTNGQIIGSINTTHDKVHYDSQANINHGGANGNHAEGRHRGGRAHAEGRNTHIPT